MMLTTRSRVLAALIVAACSNGDEAATRNDQPLEDEPGLHIEVQDREPRAEGPMRYAGHFVSRDGMTIGFDSRLSGDKRGFAIVTKFELDGIPFEVRLDNWPGVSPTPGLLTLRSPSDKPYPERADVAFAELAEALQGLYPPQDTTREPVIENYEAPKGADGGPVYPHWITVRDFARMLNRWTLVGLDDREGGGGPNYDCIDDEGHYTCMPTGGGKGGGGLPPPPATCTTGPADQGVSYINCCALPWETWLHRSEHDAAHCVATVTDQCGQFFEPDPSGSPQAHCTGKCGIGKGGGSGIMVCAPILTAGVPTQDCLDADICIMSHWTTPGPGVGYCANEVAQTTDDLATTYAIEVAWTVVTWELPFGLGSLIEAATQKTQECTLNDPSRVRPPGTFPRI